ncbi:prolyl 4-hydroxylase subunit alpha-2-like [Drosophila serrata]|uniref:prolyl 4-hydroxylase subunit alpha-2-like n=1 Tax=Drosophila serrata TaxID=7274 RepID=UPI000A1D39C2|nr:prolyl 4-hydroxylase subunit alpha-2-like [Drosophila serrata]
MQVSCLLLGLFYFLSPGQGQEVDEYDFVPPKGFARSVINMDELLYLEDFLVLNLEQYIEALSQKANTIRMGIQEMTTRYKERLESGLKPAWNPFNSYSLIRHMQSDWMMWQVYLKKPVGQEQLNYLNSKMQLLPQDIDFQDAAEGIWMIQSVYEMSAFDIASGLLDGVQYNASLTARDCLEMGRHLMNQSHWNEAKEWIDTGIEALNRINLQQEMQELVGTSKKELLATMRQVLVKMNDSTAALKAYETALKESPYDAELLQEFHLAETELLTKPVDAQLDDDSSDMYQKLSCCSGRCELHPELQLYCLYNTKAFPFLRLAPIKTEILSLDPYIVLFHDVVSPKYMHDIRNGSKSYLLPTSTYNPKEGKSRIVSYRTSKSVWLPWDLNNATMGITTMLEDATSLDMNKSELFQVMNYGVGGVFKIHLDLLLKDEERFNGTADRIATGLVYLSEVQQGGGTTFPYLNLTVFPQPGSVLFWYNQDTRGNEDTYTSHAGCPVIVGSKWVMSKWIEDIGQEFRKPCFDLEDPYSTKLTS